MEPWSDIDRYIAERLVRDDPVTRTDGLPPHAVTAPQGALLEPLARAIGARRILEIGTLGGYSTIWLARALPPDGRLVTLEIDPSYAEVARTNLAGADQVELIVGPALETLPTLDGPFDLVFIDVAAEAGVRSTAIQTVGSKGYDGFALVLVG